MAQTFVRLGSDLALTRYVGTPSAVALESAESWGGVDLSVGPGSLGRRASTGDVTDLRVVSERANLGQALIVRLLTPLGGLAPLGHPDYGSRLGELIGRGNDARARNLARLYVIEALRGEPRVVKLLDLSVTTTPDRPETVRIAFAVQPRDDDQPLALGLEVAL